MNGLETKIIMTPCKPSVWMLAGIFLMMPFAGHADPIVWQSTRAAAVAAALDSGKLVLLIAGRDTCGNTQYMKNTVCETPGVRQVIDANYVCWYGLVDSSTELGPYVAGLGAFTLPVICVIDPGDFSNYLDRSTGTQSESVFKDRLSFHVPANPELPDGLDNDGDGLIDEGLRVSKTCFSLDQSVHCAGAGWSRTLVLDLTNFRNIAIRDGYGSYSTDYSLYYNIWTGIYLYDYNAGAFSVVTWLTSLNL